MFDTLVEKLAISNKTKKSGSRKIKLYIYDNGSGYFSVGRKDYLDVFTNLKISKSITKLIERFDNGDFD